ncbi:Pathogenesis-related protein PR-1 [Vitis vinifera]|uniref:Pathogenesis-related protein PR-1 n=1 Tax=Vitis vinifera TaxID=29760 RepID=A0A438D2Z1_VITVI|nr:Pathogenesis-related protein PR-1 [Vitis vinifera]
MSPWHCVLVIYLILITSSSAVDAITKPSSSSSSYLSLANQFLAPHNAARTAVGMRRLVWDSKLAHYAEWYANQRRRDCALKHSNGSTERTSSGVVAVGGHQLRLLQLGFRSAGGTTTGPTPVLMAKNADTTPRLCGAQHGELGVPG